MMQATQLTNWLQKSSMTTIEDWGMGEEPDCAQPIFAIAQLKRLFRIIFTQILSPIYQEALGGTTMGPRQAVGLVELT